MSALVLQLLASACLAAPLDPAAQARLTAMTGLGGEGQVVTEESLGREAAGRKEELRAAALSAAPYLDLSVKSSGRNDPPMGLDGPTCFDAAPKLAFLLRAQGFPVTVASAAGHVFLIARYPEGFLIVDPTIRQWLGQSAAPSWVPQVFVGTLGELRSLFARGAASAVLPYRRIYFDAEWLAYRRDSSMLKARDAFLRRPGSTENAPLTEWLNARERRRRLTSFGEGLERRTH